jgi:hypothetical protein
MLLNLAIMVYIYFNIIKGGNMRTFKYKVIWNSIWSKPDIFLVDTLEEVNHLKYYGREAQYLVEVEEGNFSLND